MKPRVICTSVLGIFLVLGAYELRGEGNPELTFAEKGRSATNAEPARVELEGEVVCLPEAMHAWYGAELPTGHTHVFGFHSKDGPFYTLLRTKYSEALFADERVRQKQLILTGRIFPKTHILDVSRIRALRAGVVYDLFYYCSICHIESISPGPCECCQGPVELTERPWHRRLRD